MKERENSNRLRRRAEGRKARRETRSEERIRADAEEMGLHRSTDGGGGVSQLGHFFLAEGPSSSLSMGTLGLEANGALNRLGK